MRYVFNKLTKENKGFPFTNFGLSDGKYPVWYPFFKFR